MSLASKRKTCFPEGRVRLLVSKNLESLLRNCRSADVSVADDAMYVVLNYSADGLPSVQQTIAEAMLSLMEVLVKSGIHANKKRIGDCIMRLTMVLRSMSKPQRQKWVSLMVKLLMSRDVKADPLIWRLNMLWLADDNPRETYTEARKQLRTLATSASALRADLQYLIHSS